MDNFPLIAEIPPRVMIVRIAASDQEAQRAVMRSLTPSNTVEFVWEDPSTYGGHGLPDDVPDPVLPLRS